MLGGTFLRPIVVLTIAAFALLQTSGAVSAVTVDPSHPFEGSYDVSPFTAPYSGASFVFWGYSGGISGTIGYAFYDSSHTLLASSNDVGTIPAATIPISLF